MLTFWGAIGVAVVALAALPRKPREWAKADIAAEEKWRAKMLAERRCPDSGLGLRETQTSDGPLFACSICDCLGYTAKEVGPA